MTRSEQASVLARDQLLAAVEVERAKGRTVAFANGCFDLIHVGHIRYLEGAANEADLLVVAINSDTSTRRLKGQGRPLIPEDERSELIAAFRCVDFVTVFDESSPAGLIASLRPDVHCKGTDYTPEGVPEREVVESYGGRVVIVGDPKDHSTTELLGRMRSKS